MNEKEEKLLRLALDRGATIGEAENAAIMFIRINNYCVEHSSIYNTRYSER